MTVAGNARARAWATKTQSNDGQRQPLAARPPPEVAKIPPRAATRSPSALPAQPQPRAAATPTQPTTISRLYRAMWMCRNDPATDPNQHIAGSHGVRERGLCKHDLGRHVHGFPAGPRQPPASATPTNAAAKSATVATRCGARSTRRTNAAVTNTGTQTGCGHGSHPPLFAVPYLFRVWRFHLDETYQYFHCRNVQHQGNRTNMQKCQQRCTNPSTASAVGLPPHHNPVTRQMSQDRDRATSPPRRTVELPEPAPAVEPAVLRLP